MSALLAGRKVALSRLEPLFQHPDGSSGARPLDDRYVSRQPFHLVPARPHGSTTVDSGSADVLADGLAIVGARTFTREELATGVVLVLAERVALLLHDTSNPPLCPLRGVAGSSDAIALARQEALKLAGADVPVLLHGDTGTGKECLARAIHDESLRGKRPWVVMNMAALAESIAVATLFGHAKGAFTGADHRHRGVFEQASGGTLFLDEIDGTPEKVQPMLLRALETGAILPLGEELERAVDVRIIAATGADLERDVAGGSFRSALFHGLAGHEIRVPTLRERRDDIARLFLHFLTEELIKLGAGDWLSGHEADPEPRIPVDIVTRLVTHPLPGNVRQLRDAARHLALASQGHDHLVTTADFERVLATETGTSQADATLKQRALPGAS